jgi:hypothetical protein
MDRLWMRLKITGDPGCMAADPPAAAAGDVGESRSLLVL